MTLAPIALFAYKRLDTLKITVEALKANKLAKESALYVFSDSWKSETEKEFILAIRQYIRSISGFREVIIIEASKNQGLATSIIQGVNAVLDKHSKVIVIEDDLVTSSNFLIYHNKCLEFYENNSKIFSIAGFSLPIITSKKNSDVYFTMRSNSLGWSTWRDRWISIDWEVKDYNEFRKSHQRRRAFNRMGTDLCRMLDKQIMGGLDSWAIRWCYHQFKYGLYSVHPFVSKVQHIGFGGVDGTNVKEQFNRFQTVLDEGGQTDFTFAENVALDPIIIKQFKRPFSITSRIKFKILKMLSW